MTRFFANPIALTLLAAALVATLLAAPATAQTPQCTKQTCTVVVTGNINGYHIQGCGGDYLRYHVRRETTNPAITSYTSFGNITLDIYHSTINTSGRESETYEINQLEWRRDGGSWQAITGPRIGLAVSELNTDVTLDIRPRARATIRGFAAGMMSYAINEVGRPNLTRYSTRLTSVNSFISTGEGCAP